jgi:hypothetical protein
VVTDIIFTIYNRYFCVINIPVPKNSKFIFCFLNSVHEQTLGLRKEASKPSVHSQQKNKPLGSFSNMACRAFHLSHPNCAYLALIKMSYMLHTNFNEPQNLIDLTQVYPFVLTLENKTYIWNNCIAYNMSLIVNQCYSMKTVHN